MRTTMRWLALAALSLGLVIFLAGAAGASSESKEEKELNKQAKKIDEDARTPEGRERVIRAFSEQLGVSGETLRRQREQTRMGFGQLFIANALAQSTGKSFDEIAAEFRSGKGFGKIANESGVKLGPIVSDLKRAGEAVERSKRDEARARAKRRERITDEKGGRGVGGSRGESRGGSIGGGKGRGTGGSQGRKGRP